MKTQMKRGNKKIRNICKGVATRLIFLLHGAVSIYLLYNKNDLTMIHLLLVIPMVFLIVESVITLYVRDGKESKYVWFCGLFYIATIVPIIWIQELESLRKRQDKHSALNSTVSNTAEKQGESGLLSEVLRMSNKLDAKKFYEIGVIICIILGRWLTPRSSISRNQLSNLLLGYVANAADIMELFESLESPGIIYNTDVTQAVLIVYTWSLVQFTLVTTATMDTTESGKDSNGKGSVNTRNKVFPTRQVEDDANGTDYTHITCQETGEKTNTKCCCCCMCHPEFFQIFVTLLMQDGPFLTLRLALCLKFKVISELHIFFLCKNAIVCILLVYRLIILSSKEDTDLDEEYTENKNTLARAITKMSTFKTEDIGNDNLIPDMKERCDIDSNGPNAITVVDAKEVDKGYDNLVVDTEEGIHDVVIIM